MYRNTRSPRNVVDDNLWNSQKPPIFRPKPSSFEKNLNLAAELFNQAGSGDLHAVESLLKLRKRVPHLFERSIPPLFEAIRTNNMNMVHLLVKYGERFDDHEGMGLVEGVYFCDIQFMQRLLHLLPPENAEYLLFEVFKAQSLHQESLKKVELLVQNDSPYKLNLEKALIFSAEKGHYNMAQFLLIRGAVIHYDHNRSLLVAVENKQEDVVNLLIHYGANINDRNGEILLTAIKVGSPAFFTFIALGAEYHFQQELPLRVACTYGRTQMVEIMLDDNLRHQLMVSLSTTHSMERPSTNADIHVLNDAPIRLAVNRQQESVVRLLLEYGAVLPSDPLNDMFDPSFIAFFNQFPPLHIQLQMMDAVIRNDHVRVQVLLDKHAFESVEMDNFVNLALLKATRLLTHEIPNYRLTLMHLLECPSTAIGTLLNRVVEQDLRVAVFAFIRAGIREPDALVKALCLATRFKNLPMIKALIQIGADADATVNFEMANKLLDTAIFHEDVEHLPLIMAYLYGNQDIINYFVSLGVSPDERLVALAIQIASTRLKSIQSQMKKLE